MGDTKIEQTRTINVSEFLESHEDIYCLNEMDSYLLVRVFKPLDRGLQKEALASIISLAKSEKSIIFEFNRLNTPGLGWNWILVQLSLALKKHGKRVAVTNMNGMLLKYIKEQGLEYTLAFADTLNEAFEKIGIQPKNEIKKGFDVSFFNPFLEAIVKVVGAQTETIPQPGKIYLRNRSSEFIGDISGYIELNGPDLKGTVVLSFPRETLRKMAQKIYGNNPELSEKTITDSVGEMTNIVFTRGKKALNEQGFGIESAIPKISESKKVPTQIQNYTGALLTVPFGSDFGSFYVEIRLAA